MNKTPEQIRLAYKAYYDDYANRVPLGYENSPIYKELSWVEDQFYIDELYSYEDTNHFWDLDNFRLYCQFCIKYPYLYDYDGKEWDSIREYNMYNKLVEHNQQFSKREREYIKFNPYFALELSVMKCIIKNKINIIVNTLFDSTLSGAKNTSMDFMWIIFYEIK